MSYGQQTKLQMQLVIEKVAKEIRRKSKQLRPKWIINPFLSGQAPVQQSMSLLPKFNKKTDTVGRRCTITFLKDAGWQPTFNPQSSSEVYQHRRSVQATQLRSRTP